VKLVDVTLHERRSPSSPAQVIPAVRSAIFAAILMAKDVVLEPMQKVFISVPQSLWEGGDATDTRKGAVKYWISSSEGHSSELVKTQVAEMSFGFFGREIADLRQKGRASMEDGIPGI